MSDFRFPKPYEVWRLRFFFEDKPDIEKERPVVVLDRNEETGQVLVAGAKVTSHAPRPDFPGEVSLQNWQQAGLVKPSVVRKSLIQPQCFRGSTAVRTALCGRSRIRLSGAEGSGLFGA